VGYAKAARRAEWRLLRLKRESPDVETPGLLVKALISSFFMMKAAHRLIVPYKYSR
jgi:hypothetical protein